MTNPKIIMKKMYNQPLTEVNFVNMERVMQGVTASPAGGNGPGETDAPARQGVGPAVPGTGL